MTEPQATERRARYRAIRVAYESSVRDGQPLDRDVLLAENPDLADELAAFFEGRSATAIPDTVTPSTSLPVAMCPAPTTRTLLPLDSTIVPGAVDADSTRTVIVDETPTTPTSPIATGEIVRQFGDYEILGELGHGGMGIVYRARQISLNRPVALKVILAGQLASARELARFQNEAEAVANLDHPGIVPIYEVGKLEPFHYFSMRLMEGGSLSQRLASFAREPDATARLIGTIARAIHHAHQRGILHRDLKPANILLDAADRPYVSDFGLAKRIEEAGRDSPTLTQTGAIMGTPGYMSPEQAAGRRSTITVAADVYGLGAILYAMLTGGPPFRGDSVIETLHRVREKSPESPRAANPGVPRDLEIICLKCLEKDPKRRYPSAEALADDLDRFAEGLPIEARPIGQLDRLGMWSRRNPALAGLVGLLAVAWFLALMLAINLAVTQEAARKRIDQAYQTLKLEQRRTAGEKQRAEAALAETRRLAAVLSYERGQSLAEQDRPDLGLLWLARSLEHAAGSNHALPGAIRASLAGWALQVDTLRARLAYDVGTFSVEFSPDGRTILTADWDCAARRWDARTGQALGEPLRHRDGVRANGQQLNQAVHSRDGRHIATAGQDGTVWIWDAATGRPAGAPIAHPGPVSGVAFSSDGRVLATTSGDAAYLWDAATRRPIGEPLAHPDPVGGIRFVPGTSRLATFAGDAARLWDSATGRIVGAPMVHDAPVTALTITEDGRTLITGGEVGACRQWDAATGRPRGASFSYGRPITGLSCLPGGESVLVLGGEAPPRLFDLESGEDLGRPTTLQPAVMCAAYSPDGRLLVTASSSGGAPRLWDVAPGSEQGPALEHPGTVHHARSSPDGAVIVTASTERSGERWTTEYRFWAAATGDPIGEPIRSPALRRGREDPAAVPPAFSPDGRVVALALGNTVEIRESRTARPALPPLELGAAVRCLAFGPDGRRLATGDEDGATRLWNTADGRPEGPPLADGFPVERVLFSPDGRRLLAVGGKPGTFFGEARLWDTATGRPVGPPLPHPGAVHDAAFSPDGKTIVTASLRLQLWDSATGRLLARDFPDTPDPVPAVAFSPDGERILAHQPSRSEVRLYDARTGQPVGRAMRHDDAVLSAAFSPDGRLVATASRDGTARLWDTATGLAIGPPMRHDGPVTAVAFTPDGRTLLTGSQGQARRWTIPTPTPGDPRRITLWAEVATGHQLDQHGIPVSFDDSSADASAWDQQRGELDRWSGPPIPAAATPDAAFPADPFAPD
jgi:WD40 repeat protein